MDGRQHRPPGAARRAGPARPLRGDGAGGGARGGPGGRQPRAHGHAALAAAHHGGDRSADLVVRAPGTFETAATRTRLADGVVAEVGGVAGVDVAEGVVGGQAIVVGADGRPSVRRFGAPIGAAWVQDERVAPVRLREGRPPSSGEVVLDAATADAIGASVGSWRRHPQGHRRGRSGSGLGSLTFFAPHEARLFEPRRSRRPPRRGRVATSPRARRPSRRLRRRRPRC